MENQVLIASVEQDGVRYDLLVRKIDPETFVEGGPTTVVQEPKIVATKVRA